MPPDARPLRLSTVQVLQTLPNRTLRLLERQCEWKRYRARHKIVSQDSDDHDVFFLLEGYVEAVYHLPNRKVLLSTFGPGTYFGELAAIDGCRRSASIVAISDCLVAILTSQKFLSLLGGHFDVTLAIMRNLVHTIRTASERITDLSTPGVMQRLGRELLRLAEPGSAGTFWISSLPTQSDIARQIGTRRETVARTLAQLAQDGLIERQGRGLRIPDRARLEETLARLSLR